MLVSPVNNIIIKLPFYNKWLADTFNGLSGHQLRFPVKSCFGFGLRFVNREQQTHYLKCCSVAKTVVGVTALTLVLRAIFK